MRAPRTSCALEQGYEGEPDVVEVLRNCARPRPIQPVAHGVRRQLRVTNGVDPERLRGVVQSVERDRNRHKRELLGRKALAVVKCACVAHAVLTF